MRNLFSFGLAVLAAAMFFGCDKAGSPQPPCYTGRVVGWTCVDGLLIDVAPGYAIGAPAVVGWASGDTLLGRNVIAVANTAELRNLVAAGQRLYFNCTTTPSQHSTGLGCYVNDGVKTTIPHLELSNTSTTACSPKQ